MTEFSSKEYALELDRRDSLAHFRERFSFPEANDGYSLLYMCSNSLGLQPKAASADVKGILDDWSNLGVKGHFQGESPWTKYHQRPARLMAQIVGANEDEVVMMNTLTVNLHLMMVSFYRPSPSRYKVLIEQDTFPSDRYAIVSQMNWHGLDPEECLLEVKPKPGSSTIDLEDLASILEERGNEIALVLIGNTNYYSGQFFNMHTITKLAHDAGCIVGFNCAHAVGNVPLKLNDSGCDFALWSTYKYLCCGPGAISGVYINRRHHRAQLPRLEGWWGHSMTTRFKMPSHFEPILAAEGWQISNPPVLAMAPMLSSLSLFVEAGIENLRNKSKKLTGYLELLILSLKDPRIEIITPSDPEQRGCQLSVRVKDSDKSLYERISGLGAIVDWREPDVIRVAPAPLYNSFLDVFKFYEILKIALK